MKENKKQKIKKEEEKMQKETAQQYIRIPCTKYHCSQTIMKTGVISSKWNVLSRQKANNLSSINISRNCEDQREYITKFRWET